MLYKIGMIYLWFRQHILTLIIFIIIIGPPRNGMQTRGSNRIVEALMGNWKGFQSSVICRTSASTSSVLKSSILRLLLSLSLSVVNPFYMQPIATTYPTPAPLGGCPLTRDYTLSICLVDCLVRFVVSFLLKKLFSHLYISVLGVSRDGH